MRPSIALKTRTKQDYIATYLAVLTPNPPTKFRGNYSLSIIIMKSQSLINMLNMIENKQSKIKGGRERD